MVIRPGETRLWRIGNVGANVYYRLRLAGHQFQVVAVDGNRLSHIVAKDELLIPPGSRVEALVQGASRARISSGPSQSTPGRKVTSTRKPYSRRCSSRATRRRA